MKGVAARLESNKKSNINRWINYPLRLFRSFRGFFFHHAYTGASEDHISYAPKIWVLSPEDMGLLPVRPYMRCRRTYIIKEFGMATVAPACTRKRTYGVMPIAPMVTFNHTNGDFQSHHRCADTPSLVRQSEDMVATVNHSMSYRVNIMIHNG